MKITWEGCYSTRLGLNVALRVETGGVPRFVNVFVRNEDLGTDDPVEIQQFLRNVDKLRDQPPWADTPLPGIG